MRSILVILTVVLIIYEHMFGVNRPFQEENGSELQLFQGGHYLCQFIDRTGQLLHAGLYPYQQIDGNGDGEAEVGYQSKHLVHGDTSFPLLLGIPFGSGLPPAASRQPLPWGIPLGSRLALGGFMCECSVRNMVEADDAHMVYQTNNGIGLTDLMLKE
jgi:hypothetical protein